MMLFLVEIARLQTPRASTALIIITVPKKTTKGEVKCKDYLAFRYADAVSAAEQ